MFIVRTIVTKPANAAWYQHNPALGTERLSQWIAVQPTLIRTRTRKLGRNRRVNTMMFADQAAYQTFKTALEATPQHVDKMSYFTQNGFKVKTQLYQMISSTVV